MKLYYVVGSPNCRKVHAVINHLGINVDIEYLDFFTGDLKNFVIVSFNSHFLYSAGVGSLETTTLAGRSDGSG